MLRKIIVGVYIETKFIKILKLTLKMKRRQSNYWVPFLYQIVGLSYETKKQKRRVDDDEASLFPLEESN